MRLGTTMPIGIKSSFEMCLFAHLLVSLVKKSDHHGHGDWDIHLLSSIDG